MFFFDNKAFDVWMASRPQCVQDLAAEFPLDTALYIDGLLYRVIGWNESDGLLVSQFSLWDHYDRALQNQKTVCASHVRDGSIARHAAP